MKVKLLRQLRKNLRIVKDRSLYVLESRKSSGARWIYVTCGTTMDTPLRRLHTRIKQNNWYVKLSSQKRCKRDYSDYLKREARLIHII